MTDHQWKLGQWVTMGPRLGEPVRISTVMTVTADGGCVVDWYRYLDDGASVDGIHARIWPATKHDIATVDALCAESTPEPPAMLLPSMETTRALPDVGPWYDTLSTAIKATCDGCGVPARLLRGRR